MYSSSSMQWEGFDEIMTCVWENLENIEMFSRNFVQHVYYGSLFTALFLHSFKSWFKSLNINISGSSDKPKKYQSL